MRDDLRAALRSFRSSKSFTAVTLVVLTLGIGATTAIFTVVDAVVLRGLPYDEHDRLVAVGQRVLTSRPSPVPVADPDALAPVAPQNYLDWIAEQRVFASIGAVASGWLTLHEPGAEPESLVPQRVTASFFEVLRARPALGRTFTVANEVAGRDRVAVLSDGLWRRRFGGDPGVIGRSIPLEDLEGGRAAADTGGYEVIGVMPPEFTSPVGTGRTTDIWIPYVVPQEQRIRDPGAYVAYLQVIGRLKEGVSLEQARAQMAQVDAAIRQANPVWNRSITVGVRPLVDHIVGARIKSWMLMLLAAVGMVLLIACANVASLLLARSTARQRDVAVRSALGASRWRLVRQLMVEHLLLAAVATACAVLGAWWAVEVLRASMPEGVPRVSTIAVNLRVLGAASALALITGLLFGTAPALQLSKPDLSQALKDDGRSGVSATRQRLRSALVVGEVALAVILLVGAALFIGSFVSVIRIEPGFSPDHVLVAQVSPRIESRTEPRDFGPALADVLDRIRRVPGVLHASMIAGNIPLRGVTTSSSVTIPGRIELGDNQMIIVRRVTAEFHQAFTIPIRRGRLFDATDRKGSPSVVLINEAAARKFFANDDPIGRTMSGATIVGIVGDTRQSLEADSLPEMYRLADQGRVSGGELVVRTSGDPYDVVPGIKAAVYAVLPDVPLRNVGTVEELMARRLAQRRLNMLLLGLFGVLGLVIAAVGVYGLMAFVVAQRTREIGVRLALGASRSRVVWMVLVRAAGLVATGVLIGSIAAWSLSATAKAFLFRLEPTDPRAYAVAIASLVAASLVATVIPARRAATVDPIVALRTE